MSLTTQLHGGRLAAWCAANLPGTERLAAEVTAAARTHRPVRPDGQVPAEHWAAIGGAFGQRLAFAVQQAPPYYALYGLVRAGIASRPWADVTASLFPTHAGLPAELAAKALELRPTPGGWADLGDPAGTGVVETPDEPVLSEFFARPPWSVVGARRGPGGRRAASGPGARAAEAAVAQPGGVAALTEDGADGVPGPEAVHERRDHVALEGVDHVALLGDVVERGDQVVGGDLVRGRQAQDPLSVIVLAASGLPNAVESIVHAGGPPLLASQGVARQRVKAIGHRHLRSV